jgi:ABC-type molybdate transport system substrate-binding protein
MKELNSVAVIIAMRRVSGMVLGIALAVAVFAVQPAVPAQAGPELAVIPPNKDTDLKFYSTDGKIQNGAAALEHMTSDANLVVWVAGNQFFAMDAVIGAFQKAYPGISVGLITLPPGLILAAIEGGGWNYNGKDYRCTPDVYASVNLGHLQRLKAAGLMRDYKIYMHNELQMMVAKGNPKAIATIDDLVRSDVRTSLPNPVSEGIMQFYARKVLERHGIWPQISGGRECVSCQTTDRNWFTAVHHRETPERIRDGKSDVGIVWKTEVLQALRQGAPIAGVELPAADSLRDEVSYAIGTLQNARHRASADDYLAFLATKVAQDAYAGFGFVRARPEELALKPID